MTPETEKRGEKKLKLRKDSIDALTSMAKMLDSVDAVLMDASLNSLKKISRLEAIMVWWNHPAKSSPSRERGGG